METAELRKLAIDFQAYYLEATRLIAISDDWADSARPAILRSLSFYLDDIRQAARGLPAQTSPVADDARQVWAIYGDLLSGIETDSPIPVEFAGYMADRYSASVGTLQEDSHGSDATGADLPVDGGSGRDRESD